MIKGTQEYKERNKKYCEEYRKRNPNADKNRYKKERFIILVRAETKDNFQRDKKCKECGSTEQLEFHHLVYQRPVKKEHFITLCKKCHREMEKLT